MTPAEVLAYIEEKYQLHEEYVFPKFPDYFVVRHTDNEKWFVLFSEVDRKKLGLSGDGRVACMNVKADPEFINFVVGTPGYFAAYHMNKKSWLTVLLDGTVSEKAIQNCIDNSFFLTATEEEKRRYGIRVPKEWLIPANPKYYDIVAAFDAEEEIIWKQGSRKMEVGDIAYMYVAVPYSAILYRCEITEVNLPWNGESEEIQIDRIMRIRKLHQYPKEQFTLQKMAEEYDVRTVRGPRGVPQKLSEDLLHLSGNGNSR
ncbi:MAG: MmcQ/YjbR family DNA-binding protein [Eubacteriales bacterium]|nr:MmcQ/YjbR family DNA-binding protein [Eubacteriales bacterium]